MFVVSYFLISLLLFISIWFIRGIELEATEIERLLSILYTRNKTEQKRTAQHSTGFRWTTYNTIHAAKEKTGSTTKTVRLDRSTL